MSHVSKPSIAIIGGGIAGVTLAIGLLKRGIDIHLYEQAHNFAEIGAGVALGPNATRAMSLVDDSVKTAFQNVVTGNMSAAKANVWFDFVDGFNYHEENGRACEKWLFDLQIAPGGGGVHRAHFLDELIKLVPTEVAHFGKHLENCIEHSDGYIELCFRDGTSVKHNAVLGCDGIKSRVRNYLVGDDSLKAVPTYTHKYAYRGLIPMEKAANLLGGDMARNSHMHLGPNGHILTFPVNHGQLMNVVAFVQDDKTWTEKRLTVPAEKDDALRDFADWHPNVTKLIQMLGDDLDRWAIFDLGEHPLDSYNKGRICVVGDAAHATSPHHGAGAGICIEDSAVLASLIAHALQIAQQGQLAVPKLLEEALAVYSDFRQPRTQWLVQSSRIAGDLYDWRNSKAGKDCTKIHTELKQRCEDIWNFDIYGHIQESLIALDKLIDEKIGCE